MRGRGVEVKIAFLYVFAVIAFVTGEAKQPLLEYGIAAVPERRSKTDALMAIADSANAVFPPAVGAGTCVVMRKIFPGCALRAVILANCSPLALAQIGTPTPPLRFAQPHVLEPLIFARHFSRVICWLR